jgi:tetratricopeptide (TPR) repeat protein
MNNKNTKTIYLFLSVFLLISLSLKSQPNVDSLESILKKEQNTEKKIDLLISLSSKSKQNDKALEYILKAKDIHKNSNLPFSEELESELANKYEQNNLHNNALNTHSNLLEYYQESEDTSLIANTLIKLANINLRLGKYDKSVEYYQNAEELVRNFNNDTTLHLVYRNIGHFHMIVNFDFEQAEKYFSKSYKIAKAKNLTKCYIKTCIDLGRLDRRFKKYKRGIQYLDTSLTMMYQSNDTSLLNELYNSKAIIYEMTGELDTALKYYLKAYNINILTGNERQSASVSNNIARLYGNMNKTDEAKKYLLKCLNHAQNTKIPYYIRIAYWALHKFSSQTGNYRQAHSYLLKFNETNEDIKQQEMKDKIAELSAKYELEQKQNDLKILSQQNKIQKLQLNKNKYLIIGLFVFLLIILLAGFLLIRQNRIKAQQKLKELTLQNLIQQMNPHFIFNTLNSIQYYMLNHDEIETNNYMSKFASLIRKILENSQHKTVSIKNELEAIKLYLELEQVRFKNKFNFEINVSDDIDIVQQKIPTMFIQPFVENSVLHGLKGIDNNGIIKINLILKDNYIDCSIEDNGIGRKKAGEINKIKQKDHKSLGTSITNKRLKLINSIAGKKLKINIFDLEDKNEMNGTKVLIQIPLNL